MKFIAFVTKGLQDISLLELEKIESFCLEEIKEKHVIFFAEFNYENFSELRTVDDIAILLENSNLEASIESSINVIKNHRELNNDFSITVSSYKSSIQTKKDAIDNITSIMEDLGYKYKEKDHANLDIRIVIDEDNIVYSLKVFSQSLYVRAYGHVSALGSLRSTIAASMLLYMRNKSSIHNIYDPFCGTGTFLCEGLNYWYEVSGSDIDPKKVKIANDNLHNLDYRSSLVTLKDASSENFDVGKQVDLLVANLPWGKQIHKHLNFSKVFVNMKKVLNPNGGIAIITKDPQMVVSQLMKNFGSKMRIKKRKIGYIGQTPSIVFGYYE